MPFACCRPRIHGLRQFHESGQQFFREGPRNIRDKGVPMRNEWHVRSGFQVLRHQQALHRGHELHRPMLYGSEFYKSANISIAFLRLTEVSLMIFSEIGHIFKPNSWVIETLGFGASFFDACFASSEHKPAG